MSSTLLAQAGSLDRVRVGTGTSGSADANPFDTTAGAVSNAFDQIADQVFGFVPFLILALLVLVIGWMIAGAVGRLIEKTLNLLRLNQFFEGMGPFKAYVERAGLHVNVPRFVGEIFKWIFLIGTWLAASDILGLEGVTSFLTAVLLYLPNVVVAAAILIIAFLLSGFVSKTIHASLLAAEFKNPKMFAAVGKWAIVVFGILAALDQLELFSTLLQQVVVPFVTPFLQALALAFGIAFGWGGRDVAKRLLEKMEADMLDKDENT